MKRGLVLTGGGARAAYQVGVLKAVAEIWGKDTCPFHVITGISAGAINGSFLASRAHEYQRATDELWKLWENIDFDQIYRVDTLSLVQIGVRLLKDLLFGGVARRPKSTGLLNTKPLARLLRNQVSFDQIQKNIETQVFESFAVTATNLFSGTAVTFYEGPDFIEDWVRANRLSKRQKVTVEHILSSSAIPVFFPPIRLGNTFYADGGVRMNAPFSPAIHLGADKLLAIGIRYPRTEALVRSLNDMEMPRVQFADIAGVVMNAIFLDSFDSDQYRLERINRTLTMLTEEQRKNHPDALRPIDLLSVRPSQDLATLATEEYQNFPWTIQFLLKGLGANRKKGKDLLSYLAFDASYAKKLLELGYADGMRNSEAIKIYLEE